MFINQDIENIKNEILKTTVCEKIYLFGSYAYGTPNADSDYDFYVVVPNDSERPLEIAQSIYHSLAQHPYPKPVDIVVKNISDFETRKHMPTLERTITNRGRVLYEQ